MPLFSRLRDTLDELRDYRYYAEDMLHPSETAINYIWDYFTQMTCSKHIQTQIKTQEKLYKRRAHVDRY